MAAAFDRYENRLNEMRSGSISPTVRAASARIQALCRRRTCPSVPSPGREGLIRKGTDRDSKRGSGVDKKPVHAPEARVAGPDAVRGPGAAVRGELPDADA